MSKENELKQAKAAYGRLCEMLTGIDWRFRADDENLSIRCMTKGEDLPIDIKIQVDPERALVTLISPIPFDIPEEKRVEMALAVSVANDSMVDGCFDYNFMTGNLLFRMTSTFRDSLIGKELFEYMLFVSCQTVDRYNDRFLMLAKSMITLEDFIKMEEE